MRRLDQLVSSLGYCTRREVQDWCDGGRLQVKGAVVRRAADKVPPADVRLDGEPLEHPDGLLVLLNKPLGLVCSHDPRDGRLIYEVLPERWVRRSPIVTSIGRLDKETTGAILLTDLGELVQRFTSPKHQVEKVYEAELDGEVSDEMIRRFAEGLRLDGEEGLTQPAQLLRLGGHRAEVRVVEGKYHQVRRMFAACGRLVTALRRVRFGEWSIEGLEPGQWRALPLPAGVSRK